jgi:hypothetical protein
MGIEIEGLSPGEIKIHRFLKKHKVEFIQEKQFKGLYNPYTKQPLRIDFWIPNKRLAIEYNGSQHYKIHKIYHSKNPDIARHQLFEQKYRDYIKKLFCQIKEIKLLIITSYQYREIHKILRKELQLDE